MTLYVLGDSHVLALEKALTALPENERSALPMPVRIASLFAFPTTLKPFFSIADRAVTFTDPKSVADLEKAIGAPQFDASMKADVFVFSMAFTTTVLLRRWKRFAPVSYPVSGHQPLSSAVMREIVLAHFHHVLGFFGALAGLGLRCGALDAPPQRAGSPAVKADPDLLLHVDEVAREIVARELAALNIPIVAAPEETYSGERHRSFMHSDFTMPGNWDYHHGNELYGRLMLDRVARAFAPPVPAAPRISVHK